MGGRVEALLDLDEDTVPDEFNTAMGAASAIVLIGFSSIYFERFIEGDPRSRGCTIPMLIFLFSMKFYV